MSLPSVPCSVHTISVEPKLQTFLLDYFRFCIGWGKFETFIFDKTSTIFCTKGQIFFGVDVILSIGAPFQQIDSAPQSQCTCNSLATYSVNKFEDFKGAKISLWITWFRWCLWIVFLLISRKGHCCWPRAQDHLGIYCHLAHSLQTSCIWTNLATTFCTVCHSSFHRFQVLSGLPHKPAMCFSMVNVAWNLDCGPMECADTVNVVYKGCLVCGYLEFSYHQSSSDSPSSTCCGICSIPECCCSPESMEY